MNQQVVLARVPRGAVQTSDFALETCAVPNRSADEALLAVEWLAMDPYLRSLLAGRHLNPAPKVGERMPGQGIARVLEAPEDCGLQPGDRVVTDCGWARVVSLPASQLQPIALPFDIAPQAALGILGMPGLTAWVGLHRIARLKPGQTVAVSSASGTVGAAVLQLARAQGCVTIGITSSAKRDYVAHTLGADHILCRDQDLPSQLAALDVPRFDVAFDNTGGAVLEAMLGHLAQHARVVLCGMISQYGLDQRPPGPNLGPLVASRASLHGLVVYDHLNAMPNFLEQALPLYRSGQLRCEETVFQGLAHAPDALCALLSGRSRGRVLVSMEDWEPVRTGATT